MKIKDPISTTKASEILGLQPDTVRQWIVRKQIKFIQIGRNNFVSRRAINRIKKQRERESGTK